MKKPLFFMHPWVLLGLSWVLYITALSLPVLAFAIVKRGSTQPISIYTMQGIEVTIGGVLGLLFLQAPAIGWLANPLYWLSSVFFLRKQYKFTIVLGLISTIIGFLGTILAYWLPLPNGSNPDSQLQLTQLLSGFWLWLAAPAFLTIVASGFAYAKHRHRRGLNLKVS